MADVRTIRIEFITGKPEMTEEEKEAEKEKKKQKKIEDEAKKAAKKRENFLKNAVNQAWSLVDINLKQSLNRYFSLTEDYIAQNDINVISNIVGETKSFVINTVAAAKVAGGAGIAINTALWIGKKITDTWNGYSQIRQGLNEGNYNMQFQRVRMGLVDNGRGTEN